MFVHGMESVSVLIRAGSASARTRRRGRRGDVEMGEDEVKLGVDVLLVTLQQLKEMASKNNANSRF